MTRLRNAIALFAVLLVGFAAGSSFFQGIWEDLLNLLGVAVTAYRMRGGSAATPAMFIAGFLIGQAGLMLLRRARAALKSKGLEWDDESSKWDPGVELPNRFGAERYLNSALRKAVGVQSEASAILALFKVRGLEQLNEKRGVSTGTQLLRELAREVRLVALPSGAGALARLRARVAPDRAVLSAAGFARTCLAARWSGNTLALAFRNTEANVGIDLVRSVAERIKRVLGPDSGTDVVVGLSLAIPGGTVAGLELAAATALAAAQPGQLTVATDPADPRNVHFASVQDLRHLEVPFPRQELAALPAEPAASPAAQLARTWGPVLACIAAAPLVLSIGSTRSDFELRKPWPDTLSTTVMERPDGRTEVPLVFQRLSDSAGDGWKLSNGRIMQAAPGDTRAQAVQIRLAVTNASPLPRFASLYDFRVIDATGRVHALSPRRVLLLAEPLDSRWLAPGETWSGYLMFQRPDVSIVGLIFHPSSASYLATYVAQDAIEQAVRPLANE